MHASQPAGIALIIAKKDAGSPEFTGPGYLSAKRTALGLDSPPDSPDHPDSPPDSPDHPDLPDPHAGLLAIADELDSISAAHHDQATRIREICAKMHEQRETPSGSDEVSVGEAMELD